ncbi:ABC-type Fe3+ transport system, periplasmic component [Rubidibacter lacunae KORDI 51-2]|uniref:ABC-type Fe3+ transport system, periplasmic component n=1 Tax=Rubidibacter lacunae KORDI 51-2 TaxID=582515 RepID=U5DKI9_9CHRO|nr:Fe(3+) ABC transporter substrate-binding protein [Rubidibacter lacunae]ERN41079.1 ABC-type Fe3+ transport system, periplasmic component [Rubidibacter lacunae KORDI 51-2]
MSKLTRRAFLGGSTAVAAIAAGQVSRVRPSLAQANAINLYSSRHYDTDARLYEDFTLQTGIRVNLLEGKADELIERIRSEGRNSPADLLFTVDAARLWRAEQAGIFASVSSEILDKSIPSNLRHPEGLWFSLTKRARVVVHNTSVDPSQLSTYEDLAAPQWQGRLAVRSSGNVYNQSLVASLVEHLGESATEDWCRGIVANMAFPPRGGDMDQIKAAASGRAQLALANTYYLSRFAPGRAAANADVFDRVKVFFPNQQDRGTHVNVSGGGVTKTAPNREGAIRFLEYLVSPSAQAIFAQGNSEYPVVPNVPLDPVVARFGDFKEDPVNVAILGRNNPSAVQIMNRAGWR